MAGIPTKVTLPRRIKLQTSRSNVLRAWNLSEESRNSHTRRIACTVEEANKAKAIKHDATSPVIYGSFKK